MKKFYTATIIILGIISVQQVHAQEADSLMLIDKATISEVQRLVIDTQKQLKDNPGTSLSRENQLYVLELFSEMIRVTLSFYPDSKTNQVIISKDVELQMKEDIRKALDKKLKEKK